MELNTLLVMPILWRSPQLPCSVQERVQAQYPQDSSDLKPHLCFCPQGGAQNRVCGTRSTRIINTLVNQFLTHLYESMSPCYHQENIPPGCSLKYAQQDQGVWKKQSQNFEIFFTSPSYMLDEINNFYHYRPIKDILQPISIFTL